MASPSATSGADATNSSRKGTTSVGGGEVLAGALTPAHYATMNMSAGSIARKRKKLHPTQMCGRNWITFMNYDDEDMPIDEWSFAENCKCRGMLALEIMECTYIMFMSMLYFSLIFTMNRSRAQAHLPYHGVTSQVQRSQERDPVCEQGGLQDPSERGPSRIRLVQRSERLLP